MGIRVLRRKLFCGSVVGDTLGLFIDDQEAELSRAISDAFDLSLSLSAGPGPSWLGSADAGAEPRLPELC